MRASTYDYDRVRRVVEKYPVSPTDLAAYWAFFKEINAKGLREMNGNARKIKIDEIKAKCLKQGLIAEALNEVAKLVFP
jgi:hypothetical protein